MYTTAYGLLKRLLWPGGRDTHRYLRGMQAAQWLSRDELQARQLAGLRRLVRYAMEHVPLYRERYASEGIAPGDIRSFEDFARLPLLSKTDLVEHQAELVAEGFTGNASPSATGGSTGMPTRFLVDRQVSLCGAAFHHLGRSWYGVRPGDRIAFFWGAGRDMPGPGLAGSVKARIQRRRFLNANDMSEEALAAYAAELRSWRPALFRAYPSAVVLYAQYLEATGAGGISPKLIETTSEKLTDAQRELLVRIFDCDIAECYSAREFDAIAYECPSGRQHIAEERYVETLVGDRPTAAGESGEVVVTSLNERAMPLLRYRIGDVGALHTDDCPCGRGHATLRQLQGRKTELLFTPDGRIVHFTVFDRILEQRPEVLRYQVYQPDREHLSIRIVNRLPVDAAWLAAVEAEVRCAFGRAIGIDIDLVEGIPLTAAGKHRYVISDVQADFSDAASRPPP